MDRLILGIHVDTHDTGAVLLRNSEILAGVNEERYSRVKLDGAFPWQSIQAVLRMAGAHPGDLSDLAVSGFPPSLGKLLRYGLDDWRVLKLTRGASLCAFELRKRNRSRALNAAQVPFRLLGNAFERSGAAAILKGAAVMRRTRGFVRTLRGQGFRGPVHYVPHNLCHLAGAYYTSGYPEALLLNIEGSSFQFTADIARGREGRVEMISSTPFPHSAGEFYKLVTAMLGFIPQRHEGKVTGLAALGDASRVRNLVAPLLSTDGALQLRVDRRLYFLMAEYYRRKSLPRYFQGHSPQDLAAGFQRQLELACSELLRSALRNVPARRLVLVGGVAANVKLNQCLASVPGIEEVFVHPGMGDVGQAMGAALWVARSGEAAAGREFRPRRMDHAFLGPDFSEQEIQGAIEAAGLTSERPDSIEIHTAKLLAEGRVVARFSGRLEYGPRALGNRSILYRPDDPSINDWLNKRLKRTEFMPFAPATLSEYARQCYKDIVGKEYTAEFMTITCDCTEWMKRACPGVVHVDGTARPQLVTEAANPGLYAILREFHRRTGLPSLINTSFNMHEEPIVCSPADAVRTFLLGHLDHLAMGPFLLTARKEADQGDTGAARAQLPRASQGALFDGPPALPSGLSRRRWTPARHHALTRLSPIRAATDLRVLGDHVLATR